METLASEARAVPAFVMGQQLGQQRARVIADSERIIARHDRG
ncbi:hypothetical protein I545_6766 [Mycobacterium kansasii 662]|uniref:Uncharacterized protein n=1 Tax=Mycobacterium kansasii 662 TaxID=1299326 RepID=X7XUV1_MYCKA|nr:hypothetical protein I545_6766 [Mycobacterium kansasii 662]